ncbi:hypothetical protein [Emergencia timonensis]|uniref:hypothetical protein n=1 Tax=Emergencia timonensis TaxID=1776384 RepID=UPI001FCC4718|nr:hypothetical protein [Emergencia timonensis]
MTLRNSPFVSQRKRRITTSYSLMRQNMQQLEKSTVCTWMRQTTENWVKPWAAGYWHITRKIRLIPAEAKGGAARLSTVLSE